MFAFSFAVLVGVLSAVSAEKNMVRMEPSVNQFDSSRWIRETRMNTDDVYVNAVFVMKHDEGRLAAFEKQLLDLSTPSSSNYGKWLKHDSIIQQIAPSEDSVKVITDYITSFGITNADVRVSRLRDMIHVKIPVKVANQMFNTEFAMFRSVVERRALLPRITSPYYLPEHIAAKVAIVDDIMRFPSIRQSLRTLGAEDGNGSDAEFAACGTKCNGYTTPSVLEKAYSFSAMTKATTGNSVSVAEFQYQYWDQGDLSAFSSACGVSVDVDVTIGGNNENICANLGGCVEALLDIEYIGAITSPVPLTVIYSPTYSLLDWVDQVIAMDEPPLVHSVSYGNDEIQQTSVEYMESCNTQFMVAGTMGLSILFASGDQGVWGRSGVGAKYNPDFPAASPYVTAVGGTNFAVKSVIGEESAWSCGGGGFSDTFPQPSWQADVVQAYLAKAAAQGVLPTSALFNATGRAYPDVAALGGQTNPYCVATSGGSKFGGVAGTSASCPVVAGIFTQLNDVRLKAGLPSLGWLNPFIYANPQCFNDVTDGSMNNCNAGTSGFAALTGWDPATGFGTPNFKCLSAL
jgi:tripeptidyl-peptidase-1